MVFGRLIHKTKYKPDAGVTVRVLNISVSENTNLVFIQCKAIAVSQKSKIPSLCLVVCINLCSLD